MLPVHSPDVFYKNVYIVTLLKCFKGFYERMENEEKKNIHRPFEKEGGKKKSRVEWKVYQHFCTLELYFQCISARKVFLLLLIRCSC